MRGGGQRAARARRPVSWPQTEGRGSTMMPTLLDMPIWAQFAPGPGRPGGPPFGPGPAGPPPGAVAGAIGLMLAIYGFVFLIFYIPTVIGMWKAFDKAGQPGWPAIFCFIPPLPMYFMGEISGKGGT